MYLIDKCVQGALRVISYRTAYEPAILIQTVFECVRMTGPWIQKLALVSVQVASVGTTVKVSNPYEVYILPG